MAWLNELKRKNPHSGKADTYYQIQWRPDPNDRKKVSSKAIGFVSASDAKRALRAFVEPIEPTHPAQATVPVTAPPPSEKVAPTAPPPAPPLEQWLENRVLPSIHARYGKGATATLAVHLAKALKRHMGRKPLNQIRGSEVDNYILARRKEEVRSETIRKELRLLIRALDLALEDNVLVNAPAVKLPRNTDKRPLKFLTPEQSESVLAALEKSDPLSYLAIYLSVAIGLRKGETFNLRWEDVDWKAGHVLIRRKEAGSTRWATKTGEVRAVSISTIEALLRQSWMRAKKPKEGWIFPNKKDHEKPRKSFRTALTGACRRAGVPPVHPHALRHSFASRLLTAGVDMKTVMDIGGWKRVDTLQEVYAHTTPRRTAQALELTALTARAV